MKKNKIRNKNIDYDLILTAFFLLAVMIFVVIISKNPSLTMRVIPTFAGIIIGVGFVLFLCIQSLLAQKPTKTSVSPVYIIEEPAKYNEVLWKIINEYANTKKESRKF